MVLKKKQKKIVKQKQKQKQNVNVKQNVKVVVGDVKRKQVRKSSGAKASAKPPIILNISNPQPYNNPYMMYFKEQLQNQEPIKATTLAQHEKLNEREETKASKAGALHHLDQEPGADVKRELTRQAAETRAAVEQSAMERTQQEKEIQKSFVTPPKANKKRTPKRKTRLVMEDDSQESAMLTALAQQTNQMEEAISGAEEEKGGEQEEAQSVPASTISKGGGAGATEVARQSKKRGPVPSDLPTPTNQSTREALLDTLSQYDERQLQRKLKGKKLNDYMKVLGLRTHMRGASNPTGAEEQRLAIIGLVHNYKRDKGLKY